MKSALLALSVLAFTTPTFARDYIECSAIAQVTPQCTYKCDDQSMVRVVFEPSVLSQVGNTVDFSVFHDNEMEYSDGVLTRNGGAYRVAFPQADQWASAFTYNPSSQSAIATLKIFDRQAARWTGRTQNVRLDCRATNF